MKRLTCLLILLSFFLSGCDALGERIKEPVIFYYVRENYQEEMGDVISAEVREASGHRHDLPYLLALYSMGPSQEGLLPLFPRNTTILPVEHSEDGLVLRVLDENPHMTDAEYTLACACLTMTCMELIDTEQVTVVSGDRSITINTNNLLMTGYSSQNPQEEIE